MKIIKLKKYLISICFYLLLLVDSNLHSAEIIIANSGDFQKLTTLNGGDIILVNSGEINNLKIRLKSANSSKENPIIIKAVESQKSFFTGNTQIILDGAWITFSGFSFRDGGAISKEGVINFEKDSSFCRVSECEFENFNQGVGDCNWIFMQGFNNRVDHSSFKGKDSLNATIFIKPHASEKGFNEPRNHCIDNNYFGVRNKIGDNGYETIRIGDSKKQTYNMSCIVEFNYFEQSIKSPNASEMEVISNKSSNNIYRNNIFYDCDGQLTLRHGRGCLVENNMFLGTNSSRQSGVRVIGINHIIRGNTFYNLGGQGLRASLTIMAGRYGDNKSNKYEAVENCIVENNIFIKCKESINIGISKLSNPDLPRGITFKNNIFIFKGDRISINQALKDSGNNFNESFFNLDKSLKVSIPLKNFDIIRDNKIY